MPVPKFSVIIPVYNVEPYLESCLNSVVQQSLPASEREIICVNDGSTDASPEILNRFAQNYENIRVVHQANGGMSRARNAALDLARGEYIFFLDSDDFLLHADVLEKLYDIASSEHLDMLYYCKENIYDAAYSAPGKEHGSRSKPYPWHGEYPQVLDGQAMYVQFCQNGDFTVVPWRTICRHGFLQEHGLRFEPGLLHEDEIFSLLCFSCAKRVQCTPLYCYGHRIRPNSAMTSKNRLPSIRGYGLGSDILASTLRAHPEWNPDFLKLVQGRVNALSRAAAHIYLNTDRQSCKAYFKSLPEAERRTIWRMMLPYVRKERRALFRIAVKCRVPPSVWNFLKSIKRGSLRP